MFEENDREKDILLMLFVVQISILAEMVEGLVPLFFVALLVFGFVALKETARRFAESRFSERLRDRS
ncbi:hypothetical protein [Haloterrigena salinisoli]|uniref:hypothetical protein n=1 Tax=Haloterrigena salinisoli TaxID=3132747 RepID=UPI0030D28F7E